MIFDTCLSIFTSRGLTDGTTQVIPRLLSRAARASRLACASYPGLHSTPAPDATTAAARNGVGGSNGFAMDVDDGDSGGGASGGGGNKGSGTPGVGGVESAEGVELLQVRNVASCVVVCSL